jgi:steroid delta-isomerase-like uncharacterized protein
MSIIDALRQAVEAFNAHDPAGFAATYAADTIVHDPFYPEATRGRAAVEKDTADFLRAFPDARMAVVGTPLAEGDTLAAQFVVHGTHDGPLATPDGDIPATGRSIRLEGGIFTTVDARGETIDERRYYDVAGLLAQLGLTPQPDPAT